MPTVNRKRTVSVCRGHTDFTCIDAKVITHAKMQLKERILQEKIFLLKTHQNFVSIAAFNTGRSFLEVLNAAMLTKFWCVFNRQC